MEKTILIGQLTNVKEMLRKTKRRSFYPLISTLGVKIAVNIVNITKTPPYFHSRHEISTKMRAGNTCFVNNKNACWLMACGFGGGACVGSFPVRVCM